MSPCFRIYTAPSRGAPVILSRFSRTMGKPDGSTGGAGGHGQQQGEQAGRGQKHPLYGQHPPGLQQKRVGIKNPLFSTMSNVQPCSHIGRRGAWSMPPALGMHSILWDSSKIAHRCPKGSLRHRYSLSVTEAYPGICGLLGEGHVLHGFKLL